MKMMKLIVGVVLMLFINSTNLIANNEDSPFSAISLTTAKELAQNEGKYIFVDFYADWCVPCKWMDETTYADKNVLKVLNDGFVSVKINIDDFDGYTLKEEYNVTVLPTVIVLDQSGKVIRRYEESMSPSKLKDILQDISIDNNNFKHTENVAPSAFDKNNDSGNLMKNDNSNLDEIVIVKTNKSYRVQVGVYTDYANTLNIVNNLNANFDEPVVVLNSYLNSKTVYKIVVGDFDNKEGADLLKNKIFERFNIKGFVTVFE